MTVAVALAVLVGGVFVASPVDGQETDDDHAPAVRIAARKLEDGRIEFGLQERLSEDAWSAGLFPTRRFFPTTARVDRWLASSPLELTAGEVRIVARRLGGGRVEFGVQQRRGDGTWGPRLLPHLRFVPVTARVDNWLSSSPIALAPTEGASGATTRFSAVVAGGWHACGLRSDDTVTCWGGD